MRKVNVGDVRAVRDARVGVMVHELLGVRAAIKFDECSVALVRMDRSSRVERHRHVLSHEMYYVTSGVGTLRVGRDSLSLSAGDIVLIRPGESHEVNAADSKSLEFITITIPPFSLEDFLTCDGDT